MNPLLKDCIMENGNLYLNAPERYIKWNKSDKTHAISGFFTVEENEAILEHIKKTKGENK